MQPDPKKHCGPYKPSLPLKNVDTKADVGDNKLRYNPGVDETHHDTIGMVVVDSNGGVVAGTSTNGANHKIPGYV